MDKPWYEKDYTQYSVEDLFERMTDELLDCTHGQRIEKWRLTVYSHSGNAYLESRSSLIPLNPVTVNAISPMFRVPPDADFDRSDVEFIGRFTLRQIYEWLI